MARAVLEEGVDAHRAACLIRIRRAVVAQRGVTLREEQEGINQDDPMTSAAQMVTRGRRDVVANRLRQEEVAVAAVVGLGTRGGWPRDVFLLLMDLLMPLWDPMRKGLVKKKSGNLKEEEEGGGGNNKRG